MSPKAARRVDLVLAPAPVHHLSGPGRLLRTVPRPWAAQLQAPRAGLTDALLARDGRAGGDAAALVLVVALAPVLATARIRARQPPTETIEADMPPGGVARRLLARIEQHGETQ